MHGPGHAKAVQRGDHILMVNGRTDVGGMFQECFTKEQVKLVVARGNLDKLFRMAAQCDSVHWWSCEPGTSDPCVVPMPVIM